MGDFAGVTLKYLARHPIDRLTLAGGFAKLSKLAAGHLDLHSARSQVDLDRLADRAGDEVLAAAIREANTGPHARARAPGRSAAGRPRPRTRAVALGVLDGAPVDVEVLVVDRQGRVVGHADRRASVEEVAVAEPLGGQCGADEDRRRALDAGVDHGGDHLQRSAQTISSASSRATTAAGQSPP